MKTLVSGNHTVIYGPHYLYSDAMDECTLCTSPLKSIPALGIYLVGNRGAIKYPLCGQCIKAAQRGLPPASLRVLDMKLEQRATDLGLTQTQ